MRRSSGEDFFHPIFICVRKDSKKSILFRVRYGPVNLLCQNTLVKNIPK